jgi:hypothetical protein
MLCIATLLICDLSLISHMQILLICDSSFYPVTTINHVIDEKTNKTTPTVYYHICNLPKKNMCARAGSEFHVVTLPIQRCIFFNCEFPYHLNFKVQSNVACNVF